MKYEKANAEIIDFSGMDIFAASSSERNAVLEQVKPCSTVEWEDENTFSCDTYFSGDGETPGSNCATVQFSVNGHYFIFNGNSSTWSCNPF